MSRIEHDETAAEISRAQVRKLLTSPEFIASQRADCLRLVASLRGPLEQLRAGLGRLQDSPLMQKAIECQNRLQTIRLGLISELDGAQRVAFTDAEEDELRDFESTAGRPVAELLSDERVSA